MWMVGKLFKPVRNEDISYSFRGFEVFLMAPLIFLIRFGENILLGPIWIHMYQFLGWSRRGKHFFSLILIFYSQTWKNKIVIQKSNSPSVSYDNFFPRVNNKKSCEQLGILWGPTLLFFEVSLVVLTAILGAPGFCSAV